MIGSATLGLAFTSRRRDIDRVREDDVFTGSYSIYSGATTHWTDTFRTEAALRGDLFIFDVESDLATNSGDDVDGIITPKLNFIFGPWDGTEYYLNLGGGFHSNDARGVTVRVDPNDGSAIDPVDPLVRTWGAEMGTRSRWSDCLNTSLAIWALRNDSELLYVGDAGNVEAGPRTLRYGIEAAAYYRPYDWLGLDAEVSLVEGRYGNHEDPNGPWIENQVPLVISSGITFGNERGFFGALRSRYFSKRPLTSTKDVESRPSFQVNARAGYRAENWELAVDCLNLLDRRDNDIEYYYESRLPTELSAVEDVHFHPGEPRMLRVGFTWFW